jgi:hypothetical protein
MAVLTANAQSVKELIDQTDLAGLTTTLREFSGEDPTTVNGTPETILNRVSSTGNDIAAYYIKERMEAMGLSVEEHDYSTGGKNIIATQVGATNPNDIYLISAHYDSVANYCADDNASGVAAIMELARILTPHCTENTIVYAFWDEEETGLHGSNAYAQRAATDGDNILGVFNIDMMGYDGDDDNNFDIDVRPIADSIDMKDDIIEVLNTATYGFDLIVNVVNPGTGASDHSPFWGQGYSAVLFGESWEKNDVTPGYHSSTDRIDLFNMPYYHEMCKLVVGYMVTKANTVDDTITANTTYFTSNETGTTATYQWVDCDNANAPILNETNQSFTPPGPGNYAVVVTEGNCVLMSDCVNFDSLGVLDYQLENVKMYPNPTTDVLKLTGFSDDVSRVNTKLISITGKELFNKKLNVNHAELNTQSLPSGVYFLDVSTPSGVKKIFKVIKQ